MLSSRIDQIDDLLLQELCRTSCPESQVLEFKRELPSISEDGRTEFAKDVCAFANADGGDIVYGINEASGCASKLNPIGQEDAEKAKRRLIQTLEARVEPRIVGLQWRTIDVEGGYALVLRVPRSFDGPHRFVSGQGSEHRFVVRVGTQTSDLTYAQVRVAFDRTATLMERARHFRARRLGVLQEGGTWKPLAPGPKCVVHLVPIASMNEQSLVNVSSLYYDYAGLSNRRWSGASRTLNIDGLLVHPGAGKTGQLSGYTQVFRNGAIESAICLDMSDRGHPNKIPSIYVSEYIRTSTHQLIGAANGWGIDGPAIVGVSLLEVGGHCLTEEGSENASSPDMVLPECWIEDIGIVAQDVDIVVRPVLDVFFQCFDIERCRYYDLSSGKWSR